MYIHKIVEDLEVLGKWCVELEEVELDDIIRWGSQGGSKYVILKKSPHYLVDITQDSFVEVTARKSKQKKELEGPRGPMGVPHIYGIKYLSKEEQEIMRLLFQKISDLEYQDYISNKK